MGESEREEMGVNVAKGSRPVRALWVFLALTYALSWGLWIPTALSGRNVTATNWLIPYLLGGFGPSVAGVMMAYRTCDKEGQRDFWRRVVDVRRISLGWYVFIFLVFPIGFAAGLAVAALLGKSVPVLDGVRQIGSNPATLVGMLLVSIVLGALSEELGWRGFALDEVQARWSPLLSSLILAFFWWAWHLPLFFMPGTTQHAWGIGTDWFWLFTAQTVPLSVLMTWVYNRNEHSTLAAILLHFASNFTVGLMQPLTVWIFGLQVGFLFVVATGLVLIDGAGDGWEEPSSSKG